MSDDWKGTVARRPLLAVIGAVVAVGAAGGILYEAAGSFRHRPTGPYGDLLSEVGDRRSAALLGRAVLAQTPHFDARKAAQELRRLAGGRSLADVLADQAATGAVTELAGWVLPKALLTVSALAASQG
ncbi:MAG: hypothetical protein ACTHLR_08515 [Rhizomicrobium sp.]